MKAPNDTEAIVGESVIIDCLASGSPTPRIRWEMSSQSGDKSSNLFRTVVSNSHIHIFDNGSLVIRDVSENDQGIYVCQASNGIGSQVAKEIKLLVKGRNRASER